MEGLTRRTWWLFARRLKRQELAWDESRKEALKASAAICGQGHVYHRIQPQNSKDPDRFWEFALVEQSLSLRLFMKYAIEDEEKEEKAPAEDGEENPEAKEDAVQTIPDVFLDGGAGRKGWALGALRQAVLRFPIGCFVRVRLEDIRIRDALGRIFGVPVQSSETRKRCFPDLEADHPFCKIAKTKENGKQFYNNPWDSNACLVVNDRCFFVHKYFVTESSGFFKNLFADDAETTSGDYTLRLDEKLRDDYFEFILRWMYTGRVDGINAENCISMIREAKFLLMNEDFVRILYQTFIKACKSSDSSSTLAESLSQQASDLLVKELFNLLDDCGFSADLRLKCLVLWAHQFPLLHGEDAVLLRKHLSDLIEKCTADGLASLVKQSPEAFDIIPASTLFKLTQSDGWVRQTDVPAACVAELRREKPIILGGLLAGESRMGLVQTRIKRHRWHPKLLKSSDALLLSVGWRRFQTLPVFSLEDRGEKRMRYLKYTLEHAHCTMTCYGPMVPPNTGVLAFRSWEKVGHFRVCGTGVVLEAAPNFEVKKKLKLVGEPYKIFRNTAFIKNMFSSDLEVNKYMHAKIQTVSGIRGEIKKAEGVKGQFRASFEDRILMSDLVVCKCWITVPFKEFYHPVLDVPNWRPARLIGELRAAQGVPVPDNPDSRYGKQLVRPERRFNPLKVPKSLQASLPFSAKQKLAPKKQKTALTRKAAIVSSEREKAVNNLIQRLLRRALDTVWDRERAVGSGSATRRLYTIRKEKARVRQQASDRKRKVKEVQDRFIQEGCEAPEGDDDGLRWFHRSKAFFFPGGVAVSVFGTDMWRVSLALLATLCQVSQCEKHVPGATARRTASPVDAFGTPVPSSLAIPNIPQALPPARLTSSAGYLELELVLAAIDLTAECEVFRDDADGAEPSISCFRGSCVSLVRLPGLKVDAQYSFTMQIVQRIRDPGSGVWFEFHGPRSRPITFVTAGLPDWQLAIPETTSLGSIVMRLSWEEPMTGGSSILGYQVEMETNTAPGWNLIYDGSQDPMVKHLVLQNLSYGTTYFYNVYAINAIGRSKPISTAYTVAVPLEKTFFYPLSTDPSIPNETIPDAIVADIGTELVIRAKNPVTEQLEEGSTHRNYLAAIYDARGPEHINLVGAASHVLLQLGMDEERFSSMALI
ncbi:unnamed protein product [Durusdinium trenchii]|uniref:BTB domain-containing protein n=1 Tax=Durusdinium trenchii TaxID=1381693 RepID=A0ABP0MT33_9DINO